MLFRRHEQLGSVPLVLFSSNEEGALRRMVHEVGANGYISKSEMGSGFTARILRFLSLAQSEPPPRPKRPSS
jgi:PleD family two-component response regulator